MRTRKASGFRFKTPGQVEAYARHLMDDSTRGAYRKRKQYLILFSREFNVIRVVAHSHLFLHYGTNEICRIWCQQSYHYNWILGEVNKNQNNQMVKPRQMTTPIATTHVVRCKYDSNVSHRMASCSAQARFEFDVYPRSILHNNDCTSPDIFASAIKTDSHEEREKPLSREKAQ